MQDTPLDHPGPESYGDAPEKAPGPFIQRQRLNSLTYDAALNSIETSLETDVLSAAMAEAAANFTQVRMDKVNPHFKSKYASLASMQEATRTPLANAGVTVLQFPMPHEDGTVLMLTRAMHSSGQFIQGTTCIRTKPGANAHELGSAETYGRRYAYAALLNISGEEDDDGNAAKGQPGAPGDTAKPASVEPATPPEATTSANEIMENIKSAKNLDDLKSAWSSVAGWRRKHSKVHGAATILTALTVAKGEQKKALETGQVETPPGEGEGDDQTSREPGEDG